MFGAIMVFELGHDAREMQLGWNARASRDPFFYVETYRWRGDLDHFFELGEGVAKRVIDPLYPPPRPATGAALDLGCGPGRISRALGRRFASVAAFDVSEQMIATAKRLHADPAFDNITFATNDGVGLPIADDQIDFAWTYEVFQHMPTHEVMAANLNEIGRVLRRGGLALVHLKTGYERPALHAILRFLPEWALTLAVRLTGRDPMMADRTFRGAPPLTRPEIEAMFAHARLDLLNVFSDPGHPPGTRCFALASK